MAKQLRYKGEFLSRAGVAWRVEILQEAEQAFGNVGTLTFEAEEALLLEWEEKGKDEVLQGCMATLRIESPGDRTYQDLYTEQPGDIRMEVYRDGVHYWSGALDTEFYEEPYERGSLYPVSLKFSDFGILGRLKYTLSGMQTLYDIVNHCLAQAGLASTLDQSMISTSLAPGGEAMALSALSVRSDNFYDEEGEALTLQEVLEGILQPLGLRMVQRGGKVYVYDLNALYTATGTAAVEWNGDSQTMGVDVVYNNARITWSTYAQSGNLLPDTCWTEPYDRNTTAMNLLDGKAQGNCTLYSYHYSTKLEDWADATDAGFTLWTSREGENAVLVDEAARFFKIVPQYDGDESEGVALSYTSAVGYRSGGSAFMQYKKFGLSPLGDLAGNVSSIGPVLFRTNPVWIPPVADPSGLLIRIKLELLADPRFNPFEQAVDWMQGLEQDTWQKAWNRTGNYFYVPVILKFHADDGTVYRWDNLANIKQNVGMPIRTMVYGSWVEDTDRAWGYLAYYNPDDRIESSGVANGWAANRQGINPHEQDITTLLQKCEDGQFVPYPPVGGGNLVLEVCGGGWMVADNGASLPTEGVSDPNGLWGTLTFVLAKLPEIEVVNSVQFDQTIDTGDVEYSAELNAAAKEPIELDTICGSSKDGVPTARGAYFNAATGKQVTELTRAGRTTQIEELLIGTLYSQFAGRRTRLEGDAEIMAGPWGTCTEQNQPGKLFLMTGDTQDVITDTSRAVLVELRPDEYKNETETSGEEEA